MEAEQSFVVDLRNDPSASHSWVRAWVDLRALYTMRVSGQILTTLVMSPEEDEERAVSIPWRLDRRTAEGAHQIVQSGVTDAQGVGRFWVKGFGGYTLTFRVDECEWAVPLSLLALPVST